MSLLYLLPILLLYTHWPPVFTPFFHRMRSCLKIAKCPNRTMSLRASAHTGVAIRFPSSPRLPCVKGAVSAADRGIVKVRLLRMPGKIEVLIPSAPVCALGQHKLWYDCHWQSSIFQFAVRSTTLGQQGEPLGGRIATPACALVRNDMGFPAASSKRHQVCVRLDFQE